MVTAFLLPEKFQADALIEAAAVAKKTTDGAAIVEQRVEPVFVLAEKMKSPTYYSVTTVKEYAFDRFEDASKLLVEALNSQVSKASPYVSISFREQSSLEASRCLEHVLQYVTSNQNHIAKPLVRFPDQTGHPVQSKLITLERSEVSGITAMSSFGFTGGRHGQHKVIYATY